MEIVQTEISASEQADTYPVLGFGIAASRNAPVPEGHVRALRMGVVWNR